MTTNATTPAANAAASTKVIAGPVRFSYLHIWEPWASDEDKDPKYSASLIFSKKDKNLKKEIDTAVKAALEQGRTKYGDKFATAKNLKLPLRDGDDRDTEDEAYQNSWYLNANATTKPGIVDKNRKPVLNQDEVYSGCYGYASITFFPFEKNGNRGIACGLNHLMKTRDGDPLGGRSTAEFDFSDIETVDEDDDSFLY
jgi:hypothetical protein